MKKLNKKNIEKLLITASTPIYLVAAYFAVTESFGLMLEAFNEEFWRFLTSF